MYCCFRTSQLPFARPLSPLDPDITVHSTSSILRRPTSPSPALVGRSALSSSGGSERAEGSWICEMLAPECLEGVSDTVDEEEKGGNSRARERETAAKGGAPFKRLKAGVSSAQAPREAALSSSVVRLTLSTRSLFCRRSVLPPSVCVSGLGSSRHAVSCLSPTADLQSWDGEAANIARAPPDAFLPSCPSRFLQGEAADPAKAPHTSYQPSPPSRLLSQRRHVSRQRRRPRHDRSPERFDRHSWSIHGRACGEF